MDRAGPEVTIDANVSLDRDHVSINLYTRHVADVYADLLYRASCLPGGHVDTGFRDDAARLRAAANTLWGDEAEQP